MLTLPVPVVVLDGGELPNETKWYWKELRAAQLHEVSALFGETATLETIAGIDKLPTPCVLVVPALAGGCVTKRQWWPLQKAMRHFRKRGGVVAVLGAAFCLAEAQKKARGRNFEGVYTSGGKNWLGHPVCFTDDPAAVVSPPNYGFWVDHHAPKGIRSGIEALGWARSGEIKRPLCLRYADPGADVPGAMLFLNTWAWMRARLMFHPRCKEAKLDRQAVETTFSALRAFNRTVVASTLSWVFERMAARTARLETLSGEGHRLSRNMGSEKDYQRLLANDFDLCLDVLTWRALVDHDDDVSTALRRALSDGWIWAEPPHHKAKKRRGRLDLLLLPRDDGPDDYNLAQLETWLTDTPERGRVVWVELEAGRFHAAQMSIFLEANQHLLASGDFVVAVDRSPDDNPAIVAFRAALEAQEVRFIHVRVPEVFNRLEEHYAPLVHRALRKRFTTEVIRGLLG